VTATIDHLVYACPDLGPAVEWIAAQAGVRPAFGGQHPGAGTHRAHPNRTAWPHGCARLAWTWTWRARAGLR
jgi:hypothetical protein